LIVLTKYTINSIIINCIEIREQKINKRWENVMGEILIEKDQKVIGDNVAPWPRWIATLVLSILVGTVFGTVVYLIVMELPLFKEGGALFFEKEMVGAIISFGGIYLAFKIFLKKLCKTSIKTFIHGAGRKADYKAMLVPSILFVIGLVVSEFLTAGTISFNTLPLYQLIFNFFFVLLLLWIQTNTEEFLFRGLFLRAPFGNEVPKPLKAMGFAVLSSVLFMVLHMSNPEMLSQTSTIEMVACAANYFFAGFFMFLANLFVGGMEGGIVLHYLNNLYCFVIISQAVTVVPTPTFLVKSGNATGVQSLLSVLLIYALPLIYLYRQYKKKEATA